MELYVAGGCSEHGRNSFLVTGKKVSFLVDAGVMKEKPDEPWPKLRAEQIRNIDYLFLTHCHADHAGALRWLFERGFRGRVIASRATLCFLSGKIPGASALEDYAKPLREFRLDDGLSVTWGRSGHCIGSVWFLFRVRERRILFSGDYEERSIAYKCDKIRDVSADIAVLDCAYGFESETADAHRKAIAEKLDEIRKRGTPALFPVPAHGRGLDILRLLAERGMPAVLPASIADEYRSLKDRRLWLKREFLDLTKDLRYSEIEEFGKGQGSPGKQPSPEGLGPAGILVRDSQLSDAVSREYADRVIAEGGDVILTGKQDPASYARKLLNDGKAGFFRISVHENEEEMLRLMKRNSFRVVIPYHCREELTFKKKKIRVLVPGDRVRF